MTWLLAATAVMAVACGGGSSPVSTTKPTIATTEPTPTSKVIITEGVIDKRVGQPGGFGCDDGPDAKCDVTFTVTAIELDPPCPGDGNPPPGHRYLRVEVDAVSHRPFVNEQADTALELSHWSVEPSRPDGAPGLQSVAACSPSPGAFLAPLRAGAHVRDSAVVVVANDAQLLRLDYLATAWQWPIHPRTD